MNLDHEAKRADSKPEAVNEAPALPSLPSPTEMAEAMRRVAHSSVCPLCGWNRPHEHSPEEIIIYRNGVKYGRSGLAWTEAAWAPK